MCMSSFTEVHDGEKRNTAFKIWHAHARMTPDRAQATVVVVGKTVRAKLRFAVNTFSNANAK